MFHVRGRCGVAVVVDEAPEEDTVVVTDDEVEDATNCWALDAAAALACFVCSIIWLMSSSC